MPNGGSTGSIQGHEMYGGEDREWISPRLLRSTTANLIEACILLEKNGLMEVASRELRKFFAEHKRTEKEDEVKRQKEIERIQERDAALSKLTERERELRRIRE